MHIPMDKAIKEAEAAGDKELVKELKSELWAHRKLVHKQGLSTGPVDDILEHIKDAILEIKRKEKLTAIVCKWDKNGMSQHKSSELVDVTLLLVAEFDPDKKALQKVWATYQGDPIPLWKMKAIHAARGH